jgi:hypothetical protein
MRLTRPRFTIGSLLILVAISAVVLWLLEPTINPPRARMAILGGPKVDRGTVPVDVYRRHWWIIRNDGRAPLILVVTGTTTQTGLSLWSGENLVIPPGGQTEIKLTFGSPSRLGVPFIRSAALSTNDPDYPTILLEVEAFTGDQESPEGPKSKVRVRAKH